MKKVLVGFIFLFLCAGSIQAQDNLKLKLDKNKGRRIGEYYKTSRQSMHGGMTVSYQRVSFINPQYYQNRKNGTIQNKGGLDVDFFVNVKPVMFSVGGFYSSLNVNSGGYYPEYAKKKTRFYGFDTYVSFMLFPDYGKFSDIFSPYLGIGFQTSRLSVNDGKKDSKEIAAYGTSAFMWKTGFLIRMKKFLITGDYKQSLLTSNEDAFNAFSVGVGLKF